MFDHLTYPREAAVGKSGAHTLPTPRRMRPRTALELQADDERGSDSVRETDELTTRRFGGGHRAQSTVPSGKSLFIRAHTLHSPDTFDTRETHFALVRPSPFPFFHTGRPKKTVSAQSEHFFDVSRTHSALFLNHSTVSTHARDAP